MHNDELRRIGYIYLPEALSTAEQADLVKAIDQEGRWEKDYDRLAQRHGYRYEYKSKTLVRIGPLASWIYAWAKTVYERQWMSTQPDQITVQWYEPGTGIGDHCDDRQCFGPEIATISLLAPCTYRLLDPGTNKCILSFFNQDAWFCCPAKRESGGSMAYRKRKRRASPQDDSRSRSGPLTQGACALPMLTTRLESNSAKRMLTTGGWNRC